MPPKAVGDAVDDVLDATTAPAAADDHAVGRVVAREIGAQAVAA